MSTPRFDILETPIENRQQLVEASAGTGKTFALTGLVLRMLLEGIELKKILVVTFTNAATDELKTRIRGRIREVLAAFESPADEHTDDVLRYVERYGSGDSSRTASIERLQAALLDVDEASVFTIHGFCQRVLQQAAFESAAPFEPEFVEDAEELLDRAAADFLARRTHDNVWQAWIAADLDEGALRDHYRTFYRYPDVQLEPDAPTLEDAVAELQRAVDELCELWPQRREQAAKLLREIKWKKASGLQDNTDDMIDRLDTHLTGAPQECLDIACKLAADELPDGAYKSTPDETLTLIRDEPTFKACEQVREALTTARFSFIRTYLVEVRDRFDELKRAAGVLAFDDLLQNVDAALADRSDTRERVLKAIRNRWTHALIDEFQDTDPLQYRIFRTAFAGRPLFFVGDPKQAIYSFRGADLHAYLGAKEDTEDKTPGKESRYMLGTNWRSTTPLVEAVNALFGQADRPFLLDNVTYEPVEAAGEADEKPLEGDGLAPLVWWKLPPREDGKSWTKSSVPPRIYQGVASGIQELLASEATIGGQPVSPSDIAVLVRKNREAADIQQALRLVGIPAVISKSGDIWSAPEIADLEYLLRAFLRPSDRTALCSALATELWGKDATAIQAIQQDEKKLEEVHRSLAGYQKIWRRSGVLRALTQFIEEQMVTERLLSLIDGERRLTNVRHALELLHEEESRHNRGPDELLQWLRTRESRRTADPETAELRLESDEDAVQILTVHKSKGLQYNVVIAPFLWSAKENHKSNANVLVHDGGLVYDIGSGRHDERRKIADAERLAEDLRLAYVALTRAVHRCYVVWGYVNQADCSAPAYLLHGHAAASQEEVAKRAAAAFDAAGKNAANVEDSLEQLVASHPNIMQIADLPERGPDVRKVSDSAASLSPRVLGEEAKRRLKPWQITSYSRLAAGEPHEAAFSGEDEQRLDHGERNGFFAFAAGRVAGSCLHEIIEEVDFRDLKDIGKQGVKSVAQLVDRKLRAFGLDDPAAHRGGGAFDPHGEVMDLLRRMARTTIPLANATLPALDAPRMLREWSFMVPVGDISPSRLAEAVSNHAPAPIHAEYPKRLRHLDQDAVDGYLTGIADLAFEHEGRWYVLDWKSTHLGSQWDDYASERLLEAALDRHYVLQLLVYALGMHRYLRTRIPDYHYDRHMGGAGVVFLRGLDGSTDRGIYTLRPPSALIEAMDDMLKPVPA